MEAAVENSGIVDFLGDEKNDGGISSFFVQSMVETLESLSGLDCYRLHLIFYLMTHWFKFAAFQLIFLQNHSDLLPDRCTTFLFQTSLLLNNLNLDHNRRNHVHSQFLKRIFILPLIWLLWLRSGSDISKEKSGKSEKVTRAYCVITD